MAGLVWLRPSLLPVGFGREPFLALALAVSIAAGCGSPGGAGSGPADLAITNVNVVDVREGTVLRGRTVLVDGDRITRVLTGSAADAAASAATVVDGSGRYLIPGLWDIHVHFRGGEELIGENRSLLRLYLVNGVTTVRDAGGDMTPAILEWRREIADGRLLGPRILTSGPKLDGPRGGWDGSIRLTSPEQVPAAIDSLQAIGVDFVKIYDGTTSRDVYLAIIAEAKRRDMIVTGHMPVSVRVGEALDHGLDALEHLYYPFKGTAANEDSVTEAVIRSAATDSPLGLWAALSLVTPAHDEAIARRLYGAMAAAGTAVVPTLHILHTLSQVADTDHSVDPALRYIPPGIQQTYQRRVQGARRQSPEMRRERRALEDLMVRMVPRMHEAGVLILAGSDAGPFNSYVYPGFSLHSELEALVSAGLTPADALRAATVNAAEFMRRSDQVGEIREGHLADLVLLEKNPLEDITNTRSIAAVVFAGRVLDRVGLEGLLQSDVGNTPESGR